jgi:ABC-type antimicrobial peptide transport system permease subunit
VLGVHIIHGRGFDQNMQSTAEPVALVNASTARALFGSLDILGQQLILERRTRSPVQRAAVTIIGVTEDTDTHTLFSRQLGVVYLPLAQFFDPRVTIVARAVSDPEPVARRLRQIVSRVDRDVALEPRLGTGTEILSGVYRLVEILSTLAVTLAVIATVLSMAGLYGLVNNLVSTRTRELGVRISLGADARAIRRLVLGGGLRPVCWGLIVGVSLGALARITIGLVYDWPPSLSELSIALIVPVGLIAATLTACYPPARRACRVDPREVLREA